MGFYAVFGVNECGSQQTYSHRRLCRENKGFISNVLNGDLDVLSCGTSLIIISGKPKHAACGSLCDMGADAQKPSGKEAICMRSPLIQYMMGTG